MAASDAGATAPHRTRPSGHCARLTIGWQASGQPAGLRAHLDRYGPLPPRYAGRPGAGGTGTAAAGAARLIDVVTEAGLTGRGGAGFPTGVKMRAVASRRGPAVVVANGMESEPASEKDKALLSLAPHLVLDGATAAAAAVGADVVYVCLPRSRPRLISVVRNAIAERAQANLDDFRIEVHELPEHYVASEETALVHWLNGGQAKPTAIPPRPFERGVGQRPTLLDNVETLAHIALIARYGAGWFRRAGLPEAPGTMLATISGAISAPGVYEIEVGSPIGSVLALGVARPEVSAVLVGGYFGSWHDLGQVADLPMATAPLRAIGASPGTGVLFALPPGACGLTETARVLAWLADQSAGQCGPCMFGLPAIADDFAQLASGRPKGAVLDRLNRRLQVIPGRGACRHPDGAVRLARSALTAFAADVSAHVSHRRCRSALGGGQSQRSVLPIPPAAQDGWQ